MSQTKETVANVIREGRTALGIELGSTRIKAVLIGPDFRPLASGGHDWENEFDGQYWTYSLASIHQGLRESFRALSDAVSEQYGVTLNTVGAIGVSAMMHGYMAFDADGTLLTPFRTWRNNTTGQASAELSAQFDFPIPQRWSIAHLYQAILNHEEHVSRIDHLTTLAGYIHWQLTGQRVLGTGEASGLFPLDPATGGFDQAKLDVFDQLIKARQLPWQIRDLLPGILAAGRNAGTLSESGARFLDPTGQLSSGIPLCPPEGDAGTGMVATNSITPRTGNVSAGTSVFAMIVLEQPLKKVHEEIDLVMTPDGHPVAMVHANNCTSDYDAWIQLCIEYNQALGIDIAKPRVYDTLLELALKGDADGGGLLSYGYISGEHITGFEQGRPLFVRPADSRFNLANFMRTQLFASLGVLRTGLNILFDQEEVQVDEIRGHGGFFKTREVGSRIMAAATETPIVILETAGEGGAWGIALLAAFMNRSSDSLSLDQFLRQEVFSGQLTETTRPDPRDVDGFRQFFQLYQRGLPVERSAVDHL